MIDGSENPVNSLTSLSSLVVEVSHCLQFFFCIKNPGYFAAYIAGFSQKPSSRGKGHGVLELLVASTCLVTSWSSKGWMEMRVRWWKVCLLHDLDFAGIRCFWKKINKTYILPPHCVEKWWIYPSVKNTLNKSKMIKQKDVTGLDQVESTKAASTLPQLPKTPHPLPPNTVPTSSYPIHHGTWWSFKNHSST